MKAGAGGYWKRQNEKFDETIPFQKGLSCVAAVGEMLLRERGIIVPYQEIVGIIYEKASLTDLVRVLNKFDRTDDGEIWLSEYMRPKAIDSLFEQPFFGAVLQEPQILGHAVFIKSVKEDGTVLVYDSFDQTAYEMTKTDFQNAWGGGTVYRGKSE